LTRALESVTITVDKFAAQIPSLEEKIKYLEEKVMAGLNEVRAKELDLECTIVAKDDYKKKNSKPTKKLESKSSFCFMF
jgi:predicted  nucleic acid-binding Zn-ribbon protein